MSAAGTARADALVLTEVRHRFGATVALDGASLRVRRGSVHALLGENGAGKTTLMRVAFGMLRADAGGIAVAGRAVRWRGSAEAIAAGVGMVHQHFMLVPALTVAENVALGGRGRFDARATAGRIRAIGRETGLLVDPDARVDTLGVGAQQRVEIVKALAQSARTLILDEPTAVLTPDEARELLAWLRRFADAGGAVVLITHKLAEAFAVADDLTVLRRGRTVLAGARESLDRGEVIAALVGEDAAPATAARGVRATPASAPGPHREADPAPGHPVLALAEVSFVDERGVTRLRDVSLAVRAGEVLGVIGVEGAGQRELLRILAGRLAPTTGRVTRPARVGFIPEDRQREALIPDLTLTENVVLAEAGTLRGLLRWPAYEARTAALLAADEVRAEGPRARAATLSGGNQQRFVVARERAHAGEALVAENPTRGLDLRAAERVRAALAAGEAAVVYHSADLDEVLAVADRVVACFAGTVREVAPPADPDDRTPYARALVGEG